MRKCFWAVAELLCLFAIRSDRQLSHIHHCHLPPDSLLLLLLSVLSSHSPPILKLHAFFIFPPFSLLFPFLPPTRVFCQELDSSIISPVSRRMSVFVFAPTFVLPTYFHSDYTRVCISLTLVALILSQVNSEPKTQGPLVSLWLFQSTSKSSCQMEVHKKIFLFLNLS